MEIAAAKILELCRLQYHMIVHTVCPAKRVSVDGASTGVKPIPLIPKVADRFALEYC